MMRDSPPLSWSQIGAAGGGGVLYLSAEHKEYVNSVELVLLLSPGIQLRMGESLPGAVLDTSVIAKEKEILNNLHVYTYWSRYWFTLT